MRVLITGITGSGGSYLADYIKENHNVEVHGISKSNCDLTNSSLVLAKLYEVKPDIIFHLASDADVRKSFDYPQQVLENNILGTTNLFEAVKTLKQNPTILHCSTSEVYGQVLPEEVPITEDCPIRPVSPYAISKVAQDFLAKYYHQSYGLNIIRTRMFAYLNPKRTNLFSGSFAKQIVEIESGNREVLTHGNLDSTRTLLDIRDAMEAYWLAAIHCQPGEVYNIGGDTVITVREFLGELIVKAMVPIKTTIDPMLLRPTDVTLQVPNCEKFVKTTGWKPRYSFHESLSFLLDYWRSQKHQPNLLQSIS